MAKKASQLAQLKSSAHKREHPVHALQTNTVAVIVKPKQEDRQNERTSHS